MKAVVLLSGGMDSAVTAYVAKDEGQELYTLTFDYGQMHRKELQCAFEVSRAVGAIENKIVELNFSQFTKSSLLGDAAIPEGKVEGIAPTWVPQRNAIFLAIAFSYAEIVGASRVYTGVSEMDFSGYPDCRGPFIDAIEVALGLAREGEPILIRTPLLNMSKADEVEVGEKLGVPWELTWTCYRGESKACGKCPACILRLEAFDKAGLRDPIEYAEVESGN